MGRKATLRRACRTRQLVRVTCAPKAADRVVGFVTGIGTVWVLVEQIRDGGHPDGHVVVRRADVRGVDVDTTSAESQFASLQTWPALPPLDLDDTRSLLAGLHRVGSLVGVEQARRVVDALWVGVIDEVGRKRLWLHEVRPDGSWYDAPLGYRLTHLTRVVIGDGYLAALEAVAGTRPPAVDG